MNDPELYLLLADVVLILHFSIVAFIVLGFLAIIAARRLAWSWARNRRFRAVHLIAVGIVVVQAWLGRLCPLTYWESALRQKAGASGYAESFVQHWLHKVLFFDAEPWVFAAVYTAFGALVLAAWLGDQRPGGR